MDKVKTYCVVIYGEENNCGTVPRLWCNESKTEARWPASSMNITKQILNCDQPGEDWTSHKIRVLYETDDYRKAKEKEKLAESTSDICTDYGSDGEPKRKKKQKLPFTGSDTETVAKKTKQVEKRKKIMLPPPVFPKLDTVNSQSKTNSETSSESDMLPGTLMKAIGTSRSHLYSYAQKNVKGKGITTSKRKTYNEQSGDPRSSSRTIGKGNSGDQPLTRGAEKDQPETISHRIDVDADIGHGHSGLFDNIFESPPNNTVVQEPISQGIKRLEKGIVNLYRCQQNMLVEVTNLAKVINMIWNKTQGTDDDSSLFEDLNLPLSTKEDLEQLESFLEDKTNFKLLTKQLSNLGGFEAGDATRRLMKTLFTNQLASSFNYAGRGTKLPFRELRLRKVVIDAVRKNVSCRDVSNQTIENKIKDWLKYASHRTCMYNKSKGTKITDLATSSSDSDSTK